MMRRVFLCFVLLGLVGCIQPAVSTNTPPPTAIVVNDSGLHLVIAVQGQLSLKREGWTAYAPALFGTALRRGDLFRLASASQATVVCADLTLATASSSVGGVPCKPAEKPVLVYDGSLVNPTRGNPSGEFPIVVSPRKTKLLNPHPTLSWTPVAGVITYTVSVRGQDVNWSADIASKTEVVYPDDAPPLITGTVYKVIVCAGKRCSSEESLPGLGFTLLTPDEVQTVFETESRIRALGLADAPTRFLVANLYAARDLNAEAIWQLKDLVQVLPEPAAARWLGDLYFKIGLNRLAEESYLQAIDRSQKANDIEGQALVQQMLGLVYEALGNTNEAVQRSQTALELYRKLGDAKTVKQLQERLTTLPRP